MVRALVGSALLLSALGSAAALLAPSLSAAPGGRPMVVSAAEVAGLHEARFEAAECAPALLLGEAVSDPARRGDSVLALTFQRGPDGMLVGSQDASGVGRTPDQALIVVLDSSGRVLAAAPAGDWSVMDLEPAPSVACAAPDDGKPGLI